MKKFDVLKTLKHNFKRVFSHKNSLTVSKMSRLFLFDSLVN